MATIIDGAELVSSPINETLNKFPIESLIESRKDLGKARNSHTIILSLLNNVNHNKDHFDRTVKVVNVGKDLILEIQQTYGRLPNYKKEFEESLVFQKYCDCLLNFELELETFNRLGSPTDEAQQKISKLIDELESSTNELGELFEYWKSERGWNGKIIRKIKVFAKMMALRKSVSSFEKDMKTCEIKSDFIEPIDPPVAVGSRNHIMKKFYVYTIHVAEKEVGKFERDDPKLLELKKEIEFLKELCCECSHILKIYGFVRRSMNYNVILQWGEYNLQTYLAQNLNLALTKKLSIARGIGDALKFIHEKDILHYDIKSDNVLLNTNLQPKLYNFRVRKDSPIMLTSANEPTDPRWTPPEKFREEKYTKASEIYSFSLVLWEIINHKTPYHDTNLCDIKTKVLIGVYPQPKETDGTPVEYQKIMEKGWDLTPKQRPTIEEMLIVLDKLDSTQLGGHEIPKIGDIDNNFLSPSIKDDDASSINTVNSECLTNVDYVSPTGLTATTNHGKRKGFDKFNPFQKKVDFEEAIQLHNQRQYKKAWKMFKEIEKKTQSPDAKFWVGFYYFKGYYQGRDGKPNREASVKYLCQAAKDDHPDAQYHYAISILHFGLIAEEHSDQGHFKVANEYLRKAVKQDHPYALKTLGSHIKKGLYGNEPDVVAGKHMIKRANTMFSQDFQGRPRLSIDTRPIKQVTS